MSSNKFRHPVTNVRLTRALFWETSEPNRYGKQYALYTLKDVEHEGLPSLYQLYMDMDDLTEYDFANTYLDGWEHWQILKESTWFTEYAERWHNELILRTQAKALKGIKLTAENNEKLSFQANKYLLERGWVDKRTEKGKVGRPSKDAIKREAEDLFIKNTSVEEDLKRIKSNPEKVN